MQSEIRQNYSHYTDSDHFNIRQLIASINLCISAILRKISFSAHTVCIRTAAKIGDDFSEKFDIFDSRLVCELLRHYPIAVGNMTQPTENNLRQLKRCKFDLQVNKINTYLTAGVYTCSVCPILHLLFP